jgi:hypothetical protein
MYEYGTLKPVKVILSTRRGRGRTMEGWTKLDTLYAYIEMSQQNPMYTHYILIKCF